MSETIEVSASCVIRLQGRYRDVKELEEAIIGEVRRGALVLYQAGFRGYQEGWLQAHRQRYTAVRWRQVQVVTPFGAVGLPNRVIRQRGVSRGGYHSLGAVLWRGKASRLLSPAMERAAVEAAPEQNYRAAARRLWRWCGVRISHWMVWSCVQYYGQKLQEQQARDWWPDRPLKQRPAIVVTEVDSAILRTQRKGKLRGAPRHFPMHVGVQYTGRERVPGRSRGDVRLEDKTVLVGTEGIGIFGRRLRRQRDRHYGREGYLSVLLSDGDEGLRWVRDREFEGAVWLLDRWHVTERVREYTGGNRAAFDRIMAGVYAADSEAVLEALRAQAPGPGQKRWEKFRELFGYVLGNRDGIDGYRQLPGWCRRGHGQALAAVRASSGVIEKQVEVCINRRFKWQGRSWNPLRADRLAQLAWLQHDQSAWHRWWNLVCLSTIKVNPSWDS